jgi:hypothetical protein
MRNMFHDYMMFHAGPGGCGKLLIYKVVWGGGGRETFKGRCMRPLKVY